MIRLVTTLSILLLSIGCVDVDKQQPNTAVESEVDTQTSVSDFQESTDNTVDIYESRGNAITKAVELASPAIVSITVTEVQTGYNQSVDPFFSFFFSRPTQREIKSVGSGFIISEDGLVVTNEHVASAAAKTIMVTLTNGMDYEAELLGADELADLSLLKIKNPTEPLPFVNFNGKDDVMVGEWAIAMGNPFGLFADGQPSVTVGVVSAIKRDFRPDPNDPRVYIDMIQTDAAINRGNSGGPLVNSNGEVIGVNTFIFTGGTSGGNVGLGFAIPSDRVQKIIRQLKEKGNVSLDFDPGIEFTQMTRQLVFKYRLPPIHGLFVTSVNKNGPAFDGGIMPGDIIIDIGGERVSSEMHAWALMREYNEGDEMVVSLIRDEAQYEAKMMLRKRVAGR